MKKVLMAVAGLIVLGVVAFATAPIWGGCNITYRACKQWCDVRHNDKLERITCKASCKADHLSCLSK